MKYVIGNLKMNILTLAERERYLEVFLREIGDKDFAETSIILCPPSIHIEEFSKKMKAKNVSVGAQNIFWEDRGSFTGEISSLMVKQFGAEYVIVGHSERRRYFGETNEMANAKIKAALSNNLSVVYCIGETKEERNKNVTHEVVKKQLTDGLMGLPVNKLNKIIFAYEPVWAIGSGLVPSSNDIMGVKILIRKIVGEMFGVADAEKICVLYGGSVNFKTVLQVCVEPGMDGVLVGKESLIPMELVKIAGIINKTD